MTQQSISENHYAVQSIAQRKHGGGVGKGERSYQKHEAVRRFLHRQMPVLAKRGRGLIIDMHAGDGRETPHIQPDFFAGGALITTPHLAIVAARKWGADVWLCEKSHAPRVALIAAYSQEATVLRNHNTLDLRLAEIAAAPWVIVLNDPNGHSQHGVDTMREIARANPCSDFIVVVNCGSLKRHLAVGKSDNTGNEFALSVEAAKERYSWMLEPEAWAQRLFKRQHVATEPMYLSNEMTAQVVLCSNWIAGYGK